MMKRFFLQPRLLHKSFHLPVNVSRRIWLVKTLIGHHLMLQAIRCKFDQVYICNGPMRFKCAIIEYGYHGSDPFETQYFVNYIEVNDTSTIPKLSLSCKYRTMFNPIKTGIMRHFNVNTSGIPIFQRSWQITVELFPVEFFFCTKTIQWHNGRKLFVWR